MFVNIPHCQASSSGLFDSVNFKVANILGPQKCRRNKILAGCLIGLTTCNFVCALYDNEVSLSRVSW